MGGKREVIVKILLVILCVYMFLLSIDLLGASFKLMGKDFAEGLITTTANPLVGLLIGILATSVIQSSSTTTSLVVGLVAAGSMTVGNAVPIVMGANIGTSVTNTIVSLAHVTRKDEFRRALSGATVHDFFNLISVIIILPLELLTHFLEKTASLMTKLFVGTSVGTFNSPLKAILKPVSQSISDLVWNNPFLVLSIAFVILFFSLMYIVKIMRSLVIEKAENFLHKFVFKSTARSLMFGIVFTVLVQSSSATTSLIIPFVAAGLVTLEMIFPYTIGANIGTTITAILASLATSSPAAITIAFVHLLFNISGAVIIFPFKAVPIAMARTFSRIAVKSRYVAIIYLVFVFYLIPLGLIFLLR